MTKCKHCNHTRFRTLIKGFVWKCRKCGCIVQSDKLHISIVTSKSNKIVVHNTGLVEFYGDKDYVVAMFMQKLGIPKREAIARYDA